MVFVWYQSINPFLRYGKLNIWRKWPWRSRSIDPIFNRVLKRLKIHILCENGDSRLNPWRIIMRTSSNLQKLSQFKSEPLISYSADKLDYTKNGQGQWTPLSMASGRVPRYKLCGNLEVLVRIFVKLSCGQALIYRRRLWQYPSVKFAKG